MHGKRDESQEILQFTIHILQFVIYRFFQYFFWISFT